VVNFKGGVGKTTITWLLAKYASESAGKNVLVFDTDAQMSLTVAVQLQQSGETFGQFENWYEKRHLRNKKTIIDAIKSYSTSDAKDLKFEVDSDFIYRLQPRLHFIPSSIDLYWFEPNKVRHRSTGDFIHALLSEIERSEAVKYDYVFFDCPAYFTTLASSVISSTDHILIPVNPDVFASRGVEMMVEGLFQRIDPWPNPEISVFMNKARLYMGDLTRETARWWAEVKYVCSLLGQRGISIKALESYIPERENIKRSIPGRFFPTEYVEHFSSLWNKIESGAKLKI
jgi:chromosome partitioning protein